VLSVGKKTYLSSAPSEERTKSRGFFPTATAVEKSGMLAFRQPNNRRITERKGRALNVFGEKRGRAFGES